ncbi:hypothetical protein O181_102515 [Austropuccinia psidii MF-1]|uniref:Uncharacterized protein n=1 Tax=Austropuccinia psidii MF-1 TaxID=1389203 RepID=A0A9Q3JGE5_9BASI|nr:hypothetical protein [Austropuccinia psidii MF-1]
MVNWAYNMFMANCNLLVLYGLLAITPFHWPNMASGHILPSLASLANSPPHQPPGHYPCFFPWRVLSVFQGPMAPLATTRALGRTLNIRGSGPFRPPMASKARFSRHQVFRILLTAQLVHKGLEPIGPIHIPLWDSSHTVQISRWPELFWPNSENTAR